MVHNKVQFPLVIQANIDVWHLAFQSRSLFFLNLPLSIRRCVDETSKLSVESPVSVSTGPT